MMFTLKMGLNREYNPDSASALLNGRKAAAMKL